MVCAVITPGGDAVRTTKIDGGDAEFNASAVVLLQAAGLSE